MCVLPPEIAQDSTEFIFTENNVPASGFHPEIVDRVAATTRTVFEYDPNADPSNVRYLPPPYDQLECAPVFSMLPSKDAETPPLPVAAVDLLVHEPKAKVVPQAIVEKLAGCPPPNGDQSDDVVPTVNIIVYVKNDGVAASAYLARSTLGASKTEVCMVDALRKTFWPEVVAELEAASVVAAPTALAMPVGFKTFLAEPAPSIPTPETAPTSGIRIKPPTLLPTPPAPPSGNPSGFRIPFVGVLPALGPLIAAGGVFIGITLLPNTTAPAWVSELNPITRLPYTTLLEYEIVRQMSPQEILERQAAHIRNAKPTPPPAQAQPPAPVPPPATGTRRNAGQTCEDVELDRLQKEKGLACNSGYAVQCPKDLSKPKKIDKIPCSAVKLSIQQRQACLAARWAVQEKCFGGKPDDRHEPPLEETQRGIDNCEALKVIVCAPGHPMAGK